MGVRNQGTRYISLTDKSKFLMALVYGLRLMNYTHRVFVQTDEKKSFG